MKKKKHNNQYPTGVSDSIDVMLKSGGDPVEMINEMKRMILERAMSAELDYHLQTDKHEKSKDGNYRNGYGSKKLLTDNGEVEIKTARDRNGSFEPTLIPKRQRHFKGFDQQILSMYSRGMSVRDIQSHLEEMYNVDVSPELVSNVTDAVIDEVKTWQNRPLEAIYPILYLDAMVVKVRDGKHILNKSLYIAMGVNMEGKKDVLGLWLCETEGAKFWLSILNELKHRGVKVQILGLN